jgi:hypothetical protein
MANDSHRVNVSLAPKAEVALDEAKALSGHTTTDTVNRALQVYAFMLQTKDAGGAVYTRASADAELYAIEFL